MPTYDYQCRACGTVTEVIHSMLEDGPSVCELCGGDLRRVLFPTGIIFKGSGFYRNDSRAARSDAGGDSDASAGSEKPATAESGKTRGESGKAGGESGKTRGGSGKAGGSEAGSGSTTGDGASPARKAPSSEAGQT